MSALSPEEEVVRDIQRENGVDAALLLDAQQNPAISQALENLKLKLAKALNVLSDELYSKPAHFILEALQNADDNTYKHECQPELRIVLRPTYMTTECNEVGFSSANVRAFCGIGQSTKKNRAGYIGEKGIGAKSMFKVASTVAVHSNGFRFVLDRDQELGMISPQWLSGPSLNRAGWTLMRLQFCDNTQYDTVKKQLADVREHVLLFMRRLSQMTIDDGSGLPFSISRVVEGNRMTVTTVHGKTTHRRYIRIAKIIPAFRSEPKREHAQTTEVVLAFPLTENDYPLAEAQMVHAFLPMRNYGFRFIIQADFLTAANREDVLSDLQWNKTIRDAISSAFLCGVDDFHRIPALQFTWLRFLPAKSAVVDGFFSPVTQSISNKLRQAKCIKCTSGDYCTPSTVRFSSSFAIGDENLVPERYLPFSYISSEYPHDVKARLQQLGVEDMSFTEFLSGLLAMGGAITTQTNDWLEDVCLLINRHGFSTKRNKANLVDQRVRQLLLARLPNGLWLRGERASTLFFDPRQARFPSGLGIEVLAFDTSSPERQKLLTRLGVREVDPDVVAGKIFDLHRERSPTMDKAVLLEHALYVFEKRYSLKTKVQSNSLYVMDLGSSRARGNELYMDATRNDVMKLSDLLHPPARFIHHEYLAPSSLPSHQISAWRSWLESACGVATAPRIVNGRPKAEFSALIDRLRLTSPGQLLQFLRQYWDSIEAQVSLFEKSTLIEYFSSLQIQCRNGSVVPLRSTFLLTGAVASFATNDMPLLSVDKPQDNWRFLQQFGVTTQVNASFFLKQLITLSETKNARQNDVQELYKQLEARFQEIPNEIKVAFRDKRLFFVDKSWWPLEQVVWDGPNFLTRKVALKSTYTTLERLFRNYLAVADAHPTIIADELKYFSQMHAGSDLSDADKDALVTLLQYGADTVTAITAGTCTDWTKSLRTTAILPVYVPGRGKSVLVAPIGKYFLPDPSGELERLFMSSIPFLAVSASRLVILQPLLDLFDVAEKSIEKHVHREIRVDGNSLDQTDTVGVCEEDESTVYTSRVQYLQRIQHYRHSGEPFVRAISVITVDNIEVIYNADVNGVSSVRQKHGCWVKGNSAGEVEIFRSTASSQREQKTALFSGLARTLGLGNSDKALVSVILFQRDTDDIDDLLRESGIRQLDPHLAARIQPTFPRPVPLPLETKSKLTLSSSRAESSPQSAAQSLFGSATRKRRSRSERKLSLAGKYTSNDPAEDGELQRNTQDEGITLAEYANSDAGRQEARNVSLQAAQTSISRIVGSSFRKTLRRPQHESADKLSSSDSQRNASVSSSSPKSKKSGARTVQRQVLEDPRTLQIGFLGEKFVYELLSNLLEDDFDYSNWTSELRVHAGFPTFQGEELADFQYYDVTGKLTEHLFSPDSEYWGTTPEYFIEVKTSAGSQSEHFHMKRRQFIQALQMTHDPVSNGVLQLYVLFRVSNIGGNGAPVLQAFIDPHNLLSRGVLRIESDSVEVSLVNDDEE